MKYEYHTDYVPLPLANKKEVNIVAFIQNPQYQEKMRNMGRLGWELVGTQPIIEAMSNSIFASDRFGWSITTGFILFWKKEIKEI